MIQTNLMGNNKKNNSKKFMNQTLKTSNLSVLSTLRLLSRPLSSKKLTTTSHLRIEEAEHMKIFLRKTMKRQKTFFRIITNLKKIYSNLQNIRITWFTIIWSRQHLLAFSCAKERKRLKKVIANYAKITIKIIVLYQNASPWLFYKIFTASTYLQVAGLHQSLWPAKIWTRKNGYKW